MLLKLSPRKQLLLFSKLLWLVVLCAILVGVLSRSGKLRIVSLSPSTTEILFAINAGDEIVGVISGCDWPPEARDKPVVAGVRPNFDLLISLQPDLLIFERKLMLPYIPEFQRLGLKYLALTTEDITDVFDNIALIGEVTGHQREARVLVDKLKREYDMVTTALQKASYEPKLLVVLWPNPLYTIGDNTLAYRYFRRLRTRPLALKGDYGIASFEWIIRVQPDVIILAGSEVREAVSSDPRFSALKAWREGKVLEVDASLFLRGTPRAVEAFVVLARKLHPECFQ